LDFLRYGLALSNGVTERDSFPQIDVIVSLLQFVL